MIHMSTLISEDRIPAITLGWRLKMALGEVGVQEMAGHLGKSRATLTRWMNDIGAPPARAFVLQWAMRTGVDAVWLETGLAPTDHNDGGTSLPSEAHRVTQEYARPLFAVAA